MTGEHSTYEPSTRFEVSSVNRWDQSDARAPQLAGTLSIKSPEQWTANVTYRVLNPDTLPVKEWFTLKSLLEDGTRVPRKLFDKTTNPKKLIDSWFENQYPFLDTAVTTALYQPLREIWK